MNHVEAGSVCHSIDILILGSTDQAMVPPESHGAQGEMGASQTTNGEEAVSECGTASQDAKAD